MKNSSVKDWLIDSVIIIGLGVMAIYLLPLISAWFVAISLRLGRTLFWIHSIAFGDLFPHVIIGCLLGLVAACLIRHRKLSVALLPSVLVCVFYVLYLSFGSSSYSWGQSRFDFVIVGNWLLLMIASFLCARFILRRRSAYSA